MVAGLSDGFGCGAFVGVVGPSGAGKDRVIAGAKARLRGDSSIIFPQRIVTRPPDSDESNVAMSTVEFDRIKAAGGFALAWTAHSLSYAVPVEVDAQIEQGHIAVLNVSRSVIPWLRDRYRRGFVALIDAPAEVRRARILQRGREDGGAVGDRLAREVTSFVLADVDILIDNSGCIEDAARALADYLSSLTKSSALVGSA